jgi:hypothetical protein
MKDTLGHFAGLAIVAALLGNACSSDSSPGQPNTGAGGAPPGGSAPDPCTLVTIAEIQPIVERTLTIAEPVPSGDDRVCDWQDANTFTLLTVMAFASVARFDGAKDATKTIAGLGDDAFIGLNSAVYVKLKQKAFFAQALVQVKDGVVGPEVRAAAGNVDATELGKDEASYRLAKIVASKL